MLQHHALCIPSFLSLTEVWGLGVLFGGAIRSPTTRVHLVRKGVDSFALVAVPRSFSFPMKSPSWEHDYIIDHSLSNCIPLSPGSFHASPFLSQPLHPTLCLCHLACVLFATSIVIFLDDFSVYLGKLPTCLKFLTIFISISLFLHVLLGWNHESCLLLYPTRLTCIHFHAYLVWQLTLNILHSNDWFFNPWINLLFCKCSLLDLWFLYLSTSVFLVYQ